MEAQTTKQAGRQAGRQAGQVRSRLTQAPHQVTPSCSQAGRTHLCLSVGLPGRAADVGTGVLRRALRAVISVLGLALRLLKVLLDTVANIVSLVLHSVCGKAAGENKLRG